MQTYENSCHLLETTVDWQMHALLSCDDITLVNRSFSFNDMRAFATAIESNLQSLTLSDVGLTTRSISVLCQALKKCHSLALLVKRAESSGECVSFAPRISRRTRLARRPSRCS